MDCLVQRPDGTSYISRRKLKIELTLGDGSTRWCTGLAHCCQILSNVLDKPADKRVTINHLYRRSPTLLKQLEAKNIKIRFIGKTAIV
jgi:hypothetical protein